MLPEQSFEVWQVQVGAAGKLSRTYATLRLMNGPY